MKEAYAIDNFNSTIVADADAPSVLGSLFVCSSGGGCSQQPLSVALLRDGAVAGETAQELHPVLALSPGNPRAGDVVSLRIKLRLRGRPTARVRSACSFAPLEDTAAIARTSCSPESSPALSELAVRAQPIAFAHRLR